MIVLCGSWPKYRMIAVINEIMVSRVSRHYMVTDLTILCSTSALNGRYCLLYGRCLISVVMSAFFASHFCTQADIIVHSR